MVVNVTGTGVDLNSLHNIILYLLVVTIIYTTGFIAGKYIEYRKALVYASVLKNTEGSVVLALEKLGDIINIYAKEGLLKNICREKPKTTARKLVLRQSIQKHHLTILLLFIIIIFFLLINLPK